MTQLRIPPEEPVLTGEDSVRQFMLELGHIPVLSAQEELDLATRCAQSDPEAIRTLVNANLRLVVSIAREYAGMGVSLMDLVQEGCLGLLDAATRYDYTLSNRFSTYATKWIRGSVRRCVIDKGLIRIPPYTAERIRKLIAVRNRLMQDGTEEPSVAQLAAEMQLPEDKVTELLRLNPEIGSLDEPIGDDDDSPLMLRLEDRHSLQPYEQMVREELNATMQRLLQRLSQRQRQVLSLRFGMEDGVCHTFDEIGTMLSITGERARQLERQAIAHLKQMGADMGLEDFLNA